MPVLGFGIVSVAPHVVFAQRTAGFDFAALRCQGCRVNMCFLTLCGRPSCAMNVAVTLVLVGA